VNNIEDGFELWFRLANMDLESGIKAARVVWDANRIGDWQPGQRRSPPKKVDVPV
jgi:hypothetical protein